jgi:hypothetical protein
MLGNKASNMNFRAAIEEQYAEQLEDLAHTVIGDDEIE